MADHDDFDVRLSQALDRYVERAPVAPSIAEVAAAAMGSDGSAARGWSLPNVRSVSLVLLIGLLLLSMLAVVTGAGGRLFQRGRLAEAVPSTSPSPSPAPTGNVIGDGEAWIAYMATDSGRLIGAVRPDGTGRHTLFPFVPGGEQQHPDWSPDGRRLAFSVIGTVTQTVWTGDADGSNTSLLVDCQLPCRWVDEPAWSPDGGSVAYQRMVSAGGVGVSTLEIVDVATRRVRVLYTAPSGHAVYAPRWSGDGTRIVFEFVTMASPAADAEVTGDALAIFDVTATSPKPRQITKVGDRCNNPDWSWVNDRIVCTKPLRASGYDGPADLYTLRPDGTGFAPLTGLAASGGDAIKPTWLPDGSGVIFDDSNGTMSTFLADGTSLAPAISNDAIPGLHPRLRPTP
jgi:Tol biopolymer transport system component